MSPGLSRVRDRLRQPDYTGENRCVPCTTVNVAIAGVCALALVLVEPLVAIPFFALSLLAIYFRGYLVPGTPTLTKRYFPDRLLAKFDKAVDVDGAVGPHPAEDGGLDPERTLLDAGAIEPCDDVDDLCLSPDVRDRLEARADALRDGDRRRQVAAFLEVDDESVQVTGTDSAAVVRVDGRIAARWESDAALLADLMAADVLEGVVPRWTDLSIANRSQLAGGLRAFVETCPACGGSVSIGERTVESCCRSYEVYAITCDDCETRLLEVDQ